MTPVPGQQHRPSSSGSPSARLWLWGPVALYLGGITILSHQPSLTPPGGLPDWVYHVAEYGGLGFLLTRALWRTPGITAFWARWAALAGSAIFGVVDEVHQSFVPGRTASARDVLADAAGAALAIVLAAILSSRGRIPDGHGAGPRVEITLFGRIGCHLCDEAEEVLRRAALQFPLDLVKVDVDSDPDLARRYANQIPVVTINGRKWSKFHVDPRRLRRKLAALQRISGAGRTP